MTFKKLCKRVYLKLFGSYQLSGLLAKELDNEGRVVDIGCGRSSPLRIVRKGRYRVGLDFYEPYISRSKALSIHDDYVLGDARTLPFKPKSFDCAIATEVLEHLCKHEGRGMIAEMDKIARKIILTTPNGFLPTYAGPEDNRDETHLSGWTVDELRRIGFEVYGLGGLKLFWGIESGRVAIKFKPRRIFAALADVTQLFVYHYPSPAFGLFCVKRVKAH